MRNFQISSIFQQEASLEDFAVSRCCLPISTLHSKTLCVELTEKSNANEVSFAH